MEGREGGREGGGREGGGRDGGRAASRWSLPSKWLVKRKTPQPVGLVMFPGLAVLHFVPRRFSYWVPCGYQVPHAKKGVQETPFRSIDDRLN